MKVRRKVNPYREWIVKEESTSFYIAYVGDSDPTALPKADYEPVEEWVDVTYECTLKASVTGVYCIYRLGYVVNPSNTAHRVTCEGSTFKVEVKR